MAEHRPSVPWSVAWFGGALGIVGVVVGLLADAEWSARGPGGPLAVAVLALVMVAAGVLVIEFRFRGDVYALDLFDVVLAPMLIAVPGLTAVAIVGVAKLVAQATARVQPTKAAFNVSQWMASTAVAAWVFGVCRGEGVLTGRTMAALVLALIASTVLNHLSVAVVIGLAQRRRLGDVGRDLAPVLSGWALEGAINISAGVILAASWVAMPAVSVLFLVPLLGLHLASRAQASAQVQQEFLAGIHRATRTLSAAATPRTAIPQFLDDVRECLGCDAAELSLGDGSLGVHWVAATGERPFDDGGTTSAVAAALMQRGRSVCVDEASADDELARLMADAGLTSALAVRVGDLLPSSGVLCAYGRRGYGRFTQDHVVVLEAMASELESALRRGVLFDQVAAEKAKLADVIDSTSDGIATIDGAGRVTSWNAGFEAMSGYGQDDIRSAGLAALEPTDREGSAVLLSRWASGARLPTEVSIRASDGQTRWLSCSYSPSPNADRLVVIARDITKAIELAAAEAALRAAQARARSAQRQAEASRAEVARLNEREEAQRTVVHELQKAVFPAAPNLPDTELGVYYVCADDTAPTGGDLYDWVAMPNGDAHLAVIDIVGHGVAATKRALAVTHTLRLLALQDISLEQMIARADSLLGLTNPDLQATVIVARYRPSTGELIVAGGGHPPAVHISHDRATRLVAAPGIPLGWPGAGSHMLARTVLEPGDALVLYTDGLIEAQRDILAGLAALQDVASQEADRPAADLARVLVERALEDCERRDDALALVLRRSVGGSADPTNRFEHRLSPNRADVPVARRRFATWLTGRFDNEVDVDEMALIVNELCSNAVVAARSRVVLRAYSVGVSLVVEVEDDGDAVLDPSVEGNAAHPTAERGRGLLIAKRLADDFEIVSDENHTLVRVERRLAAAVARPQVPQAPLR